MIQEKLIGFLKAEYGSRVDFDQPLIETDSSLVKEQLALVNKKLYWSRVSAISWIVIGVFSVIITSRADLDVIRMFQLFIGILFVLFGVITFIQHAKLRRKQIVLQTLLFVNDLKW